MDFSKVKEWQIPEGKVSSVSVGGRVIWQAKTDAEQLTAPTILLDGDILTITATDNRTKQFVICVDGVEKTVVDNLSTPTEGLAYELSDDGTYYTCTGIGTATDTDIVIARSIDGIPVTSIGKYAFNDTQTLTSITIPDSVTSIDAGAIKYCTKLTSITIPDSVTRIGNESLRYSYGLERVVIGRSVTSIGEYAFAECKHLNDIAYNSTIVQWNAISKGDSWDYNVPATEVVCSDGKVSL